MIIYIIIILVCELLRHLFRKSLPLPQYEKFILEEGDDDLKTKDASAQFMKDALLFDALFDGIGVFNFIDG
jgi:hypothetical protein